MTASTAAFSAPNNARMGLSVSVVIPTYEERENIVPLLREIHRVLGDRRHEILVVDDRSPDGTARAALELAAEIPGLRVLTKEREGIGAALRAGYEAARNDVIVSIDADFSFAPADIPRLLERLEAGADLVLGCRHATGGGYQTPDWPTRTKYLVSAAGNRVVDLVTRLGIEDYSANFRAIRRGVWSGIRTVEKSNALLLEMILKVRRRGHCVAQVPVVFAARRRGRSKLNLAVEAPKFLLKLLGLLWENRHAAPGTGQARRTRGKVD